MARSMSTGPGYYCWTAVHKCKCPICNKDFYIESSDWAYKKSTRKRGENTKRKFFCSWKCYQQDES